MESQVRNMWEKARQNQFILLLLLTGAVYFFLKYISPLAGPVLAAALFLTIFGPFLKKLQEKLHLNRQVGAVLLLFTAGVLLAGLVWILFFWIMGSLPQWIRGLGAFEEEFGLLVHNVCGTIGNLVDVDSEYLEEIILNKTRESMAVLGGNSLPGMLSQSLTYMRILGAMGGFLAIFIVAAVLLARDYDIVMNRLLDNEDCHVVLEVICGVIRYVATYVKAQVVIMTAVGSLAALTLGLAGVNHGVFWGLLAGILDALPFIGTGIILMPMIVVQLVQGSYGRALTGLVLYIACVFLRQLLEPRLIGKNMGVPPIVVLVSLYAGIRLFGVWGIVKGPLGFILIYQTFLSIRKRG